MTKLFSAVFVFRLPPIRPGASFSPFLAHSGTSGSGEGEVLGREICARRQRDFSDGGGARQGTFMIKAQPSIISLRHTGVALVHCTF